MSELVYAHLDELDKQMKGALTDQLFNVLSVGLMTAVAVNISGLAAIPAGALNGVRAGAQSETTSGAESDYVNFYDGMFPFRRILARFSEIGALWRTKQQCQEWLNPSAQPACMMDDQNKVAALANVYPLPKNLVDAIDRELAGSYTRETQPAEPFPCPEPFETSH